MRTSLSGYAARRFPPFPTGFVFRGLLGVSEQPKQHAALSESAAGVSPNVSRSGSFHILEYQTEGWLAAGSRNTGAIRGKHPPEWTSENTHPHGAWYPVTMLVRFCKSVILPVLSPRSEPQPAKIPRSLELVRHPPSQSTSRSIDGSQDVLVRTLDNEAPPMHEVGLQHTSLVAAALGAIHII
ncbi:MAG: hypothetical protein NT031_01785, partial [Planctomycetota bacterium]|nr:hypothetical protein [Planctomycetota bacterium]